MRLFVGSIELQAFVKPEEQANIKVHVAIDRAKVEKELLNMRSGISIQMIANIDEQMITNLRRKATGRFLEILLSVGNRQRERRK